MPAPIRPVRWPFPQDAVTRAALVGACVLLGLPALEIGYRLQAHRPVLTAESWREARLETIRYGERGQFDAELGWTPKEGFESHGYNTLEHGIRRNGCETELRTGGILAVGDIHTNGGTRLADKETWPAHLEGLTWLPVLNAGVDGYATDQAILRAERLLPELAPKALVIGIHEEMIARARYASYGRPKPYFTLERGSLVLHPPARLPDPLGPTGALHAVLARSAVLDAVLAHAAPGFWVGKASELALRTVETDPVAVTCALLRRLKAQADTQGVRVLLLLQPARRTVTGNAAPGADARQVAGCAKDIGLDMLDQLDWLRSTAAAGAAALDQLYLPSSGHGQMSSKGNRATAELIAAALGKAAAPGK